MELVEETQSEISELFSENSEVEAEQVEKVNVAKCIPISELKQWITLNLVDVEYLRNLRLAFIYDELAFLITNKDEFYAIGRNVSGCLGSDDSFYTKIPIIIQNLEGVGIKDITISTQKVRGTGSISVFALSSSGELYSWGGNATGNLGLGSSPTANVTTPSKVKFIISDEEHDAEDDEHEEIQISAIAAGSGHTLALSSTGEVWAFGKNNRGQVGHDFKVNHRRPIKIYIGKKHRHKRKRGKKIVMISAGELHSVALSDEGRVYTWGCNLKGQLGDPEHHLEYRSIPTKIKFPGNERICKIACGQNHTLALSEEGSLFAFGDNSFGQLGVGADKEESRIPLHVVLEDDTGILKVLDISAGSNHSVSVCVTDGGHVFMWGQLPELQERVVDLPWKTLMRNISQVYSSFVLPTITPKVLTADEISNDSELDIPHQLMKHPGLKFIDPQLLQKTRLAFVCGSGFEQTAIILTKKENGDRAFAVGKNVFGSFGTGVETTYETKKAVEVPPLSNIGIVSFGFGLDVEGGCMSICALTEQGRLISFSYNEFGELGTGVKSSLPQPPIHIKGEIASVCITELACGSDHTLAVASDGSLFSWGYNMYSQLGTGVPQDCDPSPRQITFNRPKTQISHAAAGMFHSVALSKDGIVYVWGQNDQSQLGSATEEAQSPTPLRLKKLCEHTITQIACGPHFTLALTSNGSVYFWGVCANSGMRARVPQQICNNVDGPVVEIGAAHWASLAAVRTEGNSVYIWGKVRGGKILEKETLEIRAKNVRDVFALFSNPCGMLHPLLIF